MLLECGEDVLKMDWKLIIEIICRIIARITFFGTFITMWISNHEPKVKPIYEFLVQLTFWIGWAFCWVYCFTGIN